LGDFEAVGIRVLDSFHDLGDDNSFRCDSFGNDALDFNASEGEEVIDFLDRFAGKIEVSCEPVERDVHGREEDFFNRR
jgi:hypothetical protein